MTPSTALRRWAPIAALALTGLLALTACSGGAPDSTTGAGDSDTGDAGKHVTIGVIQNQTNIPWFQIAGWGADAAGAADGNAEVVVSGPTVPSGTNAATAMQNLTTSIQPDGFLANPCFLEALGPALKQVDEATGGNAAAYNCKPVSSPEQQSPLRTFVGVTDSDTGVQAIRAAVESAGLGPETTGTALVAKCVNGVPILDDRASGAISEINALLPEVQVETFLSDTGQSGADAKWTSAFSSHSDVVLAYGACDVDAASLMVVKRNGVGGDFAATTQDPDSRILQAIEDGTFAAAVASGPWVQTNVGVRLLIDAARGVPAPEGFVDVGLRPITKDNVAEFKKASESAESAAEFFGPWADSVMDDLAGHTKPMSATFPE